MLSRLFAITRSFTASSPAQTSAIMASKNFVEDTISSNKITVFSKSYCPYCKQAKNLFSKKFPDAQIGIVELDERDDGSDIQNYLAEKTGQYTVPNVFINKKHIGGCDDTMALDRKGQLTTLINA
ncbi:glutaredoxin [Mucidula mucida]|nr:glutaredoxin [Mucidula mucida]